MKRRKHNSSDDELRELQRAYAGGDESALKRLYFLATRSGVDLDPNLEEKALEQAVEDGDISEKEAHERRLARLSRNRLTKREGWIQQLGDGPEELFTDEEGRTHRFLLSRDVTARIAALMGKVYRDPYGNTPGDAIDEISDLLEADRGVDAFDSLGEGEPLYVYVAWEDFDRRTLFWSYRKLKFSIESTDGVGVRLRRWGSI